MHPVIKLSCAFLLLCIAVYAQSMRLFEIGGVNPNILLALLVVLLFFIGNRMVWVIFVLCGALLLNWQPGISGDLVEFVGVVSIAALAKHYMRWEPFIASGTLVVCTTVLYVVILNTNFVVAHPGLVVLETLYNLIWASVFMLALGQFKK